MISNWIFGQVFALLFPARNNCVFSAMARAARLFDEAIGKMEALGGEAIEIDFSPFLEAARLLYGGPWVAERYAAIQQFFESAW